MASSLVVLVAADADADADADRFAAPGFQHLGMGGMGAVPATVLRCVCLGWTEPVRVNRRGTGSPPAFPTRVILGVLLWF